MINIETLILNASNYGLLDEKLHVKNGFRYGVKYSHKNFDINLYVKNRDYYSTNTTIFIYHRSETFTVKGLIRSSNLEFDSTSIRPQVDIAMKHFIDNWVNEYPELLV